MAQTAVAAATAAAAHSSSGTRGATAAAAATMHVMVAVSRWQSGGCVLIGEDVRMDGGLWRRCICAQLLAMMACCHGKRHARAILRSLLACQSCCAQCWYFRVVFLCKGRTMIRLLVPRHVLSARAVARVLWFQRQRHIFHYSMMCLTMQEFLPAHCSCAAWQLRHLF